MDKILICGGRSFVGKGLCELLKRQEYDVESFSGGVEHKQGHTVYGNYLTIADNTFLNDIYDVVINLAVIKDGTTGDNLEYIKSLLSFCKSHQVKKLIHFSSVMVYDYRLKFVDEHTACEKLEETSKRGYGEFKIAVDQYLLSVKDTLPFELVLVRPGYVLGDNRPCPFVRKLPLGFSVIKGNRNSRQPVVRREDIHRAVVRILETESNDPVYHFFPDNDMTKFNYARQTVGGVILTLPKWLFKGVPHVLSGMGILPKSLYSRFEGMYIESRFSSEATEEKLKIRFE